MCDTGMGRRAAAELACHACHDGRAGDAAAAGTRLLCCMLMLLELCVARKLAMIDLLVFDQHGESICWQHVHGT